MNKGIDMNKPPEKQCDQSKREFLKQMGGLATVGVVATWVPTTQTEAFFFPSRDKLPNFPSGIQVYKQKYENWSGESKYEDAWTAAPKTQEQVLEIINWAMLADYKVRAKGKSHNWSPLMLDDQDKVTKIILIDMARYMFRVSVDIYGIVTADAGTQMETLLIALEHKGRSFVATPAPGDITLGGVLAIDGHGTAIPAVGEALAPGHSYGSISNLVVSITAAVYDAKQGKYIARTFYRHEPDIRAFLVSLGRAFILTAQLQTGPNINLRCQSFTNIHYTELFAANKYAGRTFSHFLDESGRVEAIWFPFTDYPWLKVWSITPRRPATSKIVSSPYNYWFSDNLSKPFTDLIHNIVVNKKYHLTPAFGQLQLDITQLGLQGSFLSDITSVITGGVVTSQTHDIWGKSKNTLLYVKPTTLRVTANGYAVVTKRENVQQVISDFCTEYQTRIKHYQSNKLFPMNGPVEIRVTGLDHAKDSVIPYAQTAALSAIKPCPDRPEWDCAVWFDILTLPGTPYSAEFYREIETWMTQRYQGDSLIRPEWSKGWAYSWKKAWDNPDYIDVELPRVHAQGQSEALTISSVQKVLTQYDPYQLFTSPLINRIFK